MSRSQVFRRWTVIRKWYIAHPIPWFQRFLSEDTRTSGNQAEAAEAFRKWRGIGQKGHFCIWPKSNDFMSLTNRRKEIFENMESLWRRKWPLQSLYYCKKGTFFPAKEALSFQQKRAFVQEILFSAFFKWGTLAQKKGHFFHF